MNPILLVSLSLVLTAHCQKNCLRPLCGPFCTNPVNRNSPQCGCDRDCGVYGDCCGNSPYTPPPLCSSLTPVPEPGAEVQCATTFIPAGVRVDGPNEAYFMVTSCPDSWPVETPTADGTGTIAGNCASQDVPLPPVTHISTGEVYRNEYCALCNGVSAIQAWQVSITCTQEVYRLLFERSISSILEEFPDIFTTQCQACSYQPPSPSTNNPRPCIPAVRTCLSKTALEKRLLVTFTNESYTQLVSECQQGELNLVEDTTLETVFHNTRCAKCNGLLSGVLRCFEMTTTIPEQCVPSLATPTPTIEQTVTPPSTDNVIGRPPPSPEGTVPDVLPFTITLSGLGGGEISVHTQTDTFHIVVECPEGQVPVGLDCRSTQCPESYSDTGGRCLSSGSMPSSNTSSLNCSLIALDEEEFTNIGNDTILFEGEEITILERDEGGRPLICANSSDFLDCPTGLLALNETEYEVTGNDTILYEGELLEVMFYNDLGQPLVCPDNNGSVVVEVNTTIITQLPGIAELTFIGCSLSVLGSILMLMTYALFSELRTFPSLLLMNLSFAILVTNLFFIIGGPIIQHFPGVEFCITVAICLHFFYLAQFVWMILFSLQMTYSFYLAKKLVVAANQRKSSLLLVYMLIGWCLPLAITVLTIGLNFGGNGLVLYGVTSDGSVGNCWINQLESLIALFVVPLVLSLVINFILFVTVSVFLWQLSSRKSDMKKLNHTVLIRVWLAFLSITGLTWVFGFLAITDETSWAWYPFVIFNSTQGFSIFLAFLLTKKTLKLYLSLLTCNRGKPSKRTLSAYTTRSTTRTTQTVISKGGDSAFELRPAPSQISLDIDVSTKPKET